MLHLISPCGIPIQKGRFPIIKKAHTKVRVTLFETFFISLMGLKITVTINCIWLLYCNTCILGRLYKQMPNLANYPRSWLSFEQSFATQHSSNICPPLWISGTNQIKSLFISFYSLKKRQWFSNFIVTIYHKVGSIESSL